MKLFGINIKMKKLSFNNLVFILVVTLFALTAQASECLYFKQKFLTDNQFNEIDISKFKEKIEQEDNLCLKNLMGIMIYKGLYFDKDQLRAEMIFYDLSNREYPESTLNFAMLMSQRLDQNPGNVIALLLGVYKKYARDKENSHLATKARNIARNYIEKLPEILKKCTEEKDLNCNKELLVLKTTDIQNIVSSFENALVDLQAEVAVKSINETKQARQNADNVMAILSLGLAAYNIANISNLGRASSNNSSISSGPDPWFKWGQGSRNDLNLYQFKL